jgi:hypothetical protein
MPWPQNIKSQTNQGKKGKYARAAQASLSKAIATLEQAEKNAQRVEKLAAGRIASQAQYDNITAALRQAQADVASQEADVARHKLGLDFTTVVIGWLRTFSRTGNCAPSPAHSITMVRLKSRRRQFGISTFTKKQHSGKCSEWPLSLRSIGQEIEHEKPRRQKNAHALV